MGLSFGSLFKILLGVGLGILAVSCLVVTVCFGGYANNLPALKKIENTLTFSSESSMYSCSLAIAVLGCLAAVAALGAIAISAILEDQTMILIIVGGVSAVFAFGCIVAEGVYTLQVVKNTAELRMNSYYNYDYDYDTGNEVYNYYFKDHSHKKAQDYIKKAIKE